MNPFRTCAIALSVLFYSLTARAQYTEQDIYIYIDTYKELAINKMYEYKIPASITIAQGIFESGCGKSHLAVDGNNHFGIKCHKGWTGDTILIDDDELQECFRKYEKVEDSYTDHSLFLKNRQRYADLFTLDIMDYQGWARGLKAAGYATNPQYAERLISIINRYHISLLDTIYQQRLEEGYFHHYPEVHPELAGTFSYVQQYGQPQPNIAAHQPVAEKPAQPSTEARPTPATTTTQPTQPTSSKLNSNKVRTKPSHRKKNPKKNNPVSAPTPTQSSDKNNRPQTQASPAKEKETPTPQRAASQPAPSSTPASEHSSNIFTAQKGQFAVYTGYPFTERVVYVNNNALFIIAEEGDTYARIARDVQLPEKKIKKFNDLTGAGKPVTGEVVYIEKKAKAGNHPTYTVQDNETLRYIAQKLGVRLQTLCDFNGLTPDTPLKKGRIIKLK